MLVTVTVKTHEKIWGIRVLNMGTFELTHQNHMVLVAAIDKAITDYQWANGVRNLADKDPIEWAG